MKDLIRGFSVGMVELIPGLSGSTIAIIGGFYEKLLHSINSVFVDKESKNILFLLKIVLGMIIGFLFSLLSVRFALGNYEVQTIAFFIGIIFGFIPIFVREIRNSIPKSSYKQYYIYICIGFILVCSVNFSLASLIDPSNLSISFFSLLYLFTSGFFASASLILPGLSGALILTILGVYDIAIEALYTFNLLIISFVGSGAIVGILVMSKFIKVLLTRYRTVTQHIIVGLLAGSIIIMISNINLLENINSFLAFLIFFLSGIFTIITIYKYRN